MNNDIEYLKKYLPHDLLEEGIIRMNSGEPCQYIVGNVNFYGYKFKVNPSVLIPRFETEELVYKTINYIKDFFHQPVAVVDLGTGSGCISITLKKELPASKISAVDISNEALKVALENAAINEVDIDFKLGNMLEPLNIRYDCIISNPPYIAPDECIMDIVKNNEPSIALYADDNGLKFYKQILNGANDFLKPKSLIAFEIGQMQGEKIKQLALIYFPEAHIKIEKDMQQRDRFVFIFNN